MNVPDISIIVPVYKVEPYLDRCVRSLLAQTIKDMEIILVDDGSPDRCPELCDGYARVDSRIKVIHKRNEGLGMACNSGLEAAAGKYIAFCDSDDWVAPEMYRTMVYSAEEYDAQMVFTGLRRVDEAGNVYPMAQASELRVYDTPEQVRGFGLGMIASAPGVAVERQVMMSAKVVLYRGDMIAGNRLRFNSEREIISEDLFFNLDCLRHARRVVELPKTFYNYFFNSLSLTQSYRADRFSKSMAMRGELLRRYGWLGEELKTRADRMVAGYARTILRQLVGNKKLSWGQKRREFMAIAESPVWREIGETYPVNLMPLSHRLVFKSLVKRGFFAVWAMLTAERVVRGISR